MCHLKKNIRLEFAFELCRSGFFWQRVKILKTPIRTPGGFL